MKVLNLLRLVPLAGAFFPTKFRDGLEGRPGTSHEALTIESLSELASAWDIISSNATAADGTVYLPRSVVNAIRAVGRASAEVDVLETTDATWHFDGERIYEGQLLLTALRGAIVSSLQEGDGETARALLGKALHGVQDFYAHTNWLEIGKSSLAPLGRGVAVETAGGPLDNHGDYSHTQVARPSPSNETPPTNATATTSDLPSSTNTSSINSTAKAEPSAVLVAGINKDSLDCLWSPHSHLHSGAVAFARAATKQFVGDLVDELSPQQLMILVGLQVETEHSHGLAANNAHRPALPSRVTLHLAGAPAAQDRDNGLVERQSQGINGHYDPLHLVSLAPILLVSDVIPDSDSPLSFPFVVDSQMTFLSVGIACTSCSVALSPPVSDKPAGSDWDQAVDSSGTHARINVTTPQPGVWTVELSSNGETNSGSFAVAVEGESPLHLAGFSFVESAGRPGHEGYFDIGSTLPVDTRLGVVAEIYGPVGDAEPLWVLRGPDFHGVVNESISGDSGSKIPALELVAGSGKEGFPDNSSFFGTTKLPASFLHSPGGEFDTQAFYVYVKGVDSFGADFQRVHPVLFSASRATRSYPLGSLSPLFGMVNGVATDTSDDGRMEAEEILRSKGDENDSSITAPAVNIQADNSTTITSFPLVQPSASRSMPVLSNSTALSGRVQFPTGTGIATNSSASTNVESFTAPSTGRSFFNPTGFISNTTIAGSSVPSAGSTMPYTSKASVAAMDSTSSNRTTQTRTLTIRPIVTSEYSYGSASSYLPANSTRLAPIIPTTFSPLPTYSYSAFSTSTSESLTSRSSSAQAVAPVGTTKWDTTQDEKTEEYAPKTTNSEDYSTTVTDCPKSTITAITTTTTTTSKTHSQTDIADYGAPRSYRSSLSLSEYGSSSPTAFTSRADPIGQSLNSYSTIEITSPTTLTSTATSTRTQTTSTSAYGLLDTMVTSYSDSATSSDDSAWTTRTTPPGYEPSVIRSSAADIGIFGFGVLGVMLAAIIFVLA
ncbi:protein G7c precursor [Ceratocystis lukuohia]|uniref:Protein G7c n=1 Tax=Ceratocystis lukuohia TaxID=2019550 RepID=A0ABR4MNM4_9PEZI